jgi:hypothetical protein
MSATHRSQFNAEFNPPKIARITAMTMMMMRARFMGGFSFCRRDLRGWRDPDASGGTDKTMAPTRRSVVGG